MLAEALHIKTERTYARTLCPFALALLNKARPDVLCTPAGAPRFCFVLIKRQNSDKGQHLSRVDVDAQHRRDKEDQID